MKTKSPFDLWWESIQRRCEEAYAFAWRTGRELAGARSVGDFIVRGGTRLRAAYRFFLGLNVIVLGPKGSGKTTLINMLHTGRPALHNPTAGVALVDRRVELTDANWVKLPSDVGGDDLYRPLWAQLMVDIDPEVLILILDGRKSSTDVVDDVRRSMRDALSLRASDQGRLRLIYVFINFWDVWNLESAKRDTLRSRVQLTVDEEKGAYGLSGLRVGAWATQMNPNHSAWPELENALQHLGKDLGA
jgi:hypothetical protein